MPPDLYAFENLWRQYRACRRNKRTTLNQLRFEVDAEANLLALQAELRAHTYRPGPSICFVTRGRKPREVFAADFRDRIVHHLLVAEQERVFEPRFIHDSYTCRAGKGTLAASDRLMRFLRAGTANGRRPLWAVHLDVFRSLDDRTPSPGRPGYPVAARKSLFGTGNRRGLPIGNLTSQFWANVYLNEVDQFAKRVLGCRYYLRYVDDLILLSREHEELVRWRERIAAFVWDRLRLRLRAEGGEPVPVSAGVDFFGWRTWWSHCVPRRRTLANLRERVAGFERRHVVRTFGGSAWRVAVPRAAGVQRHVSVAARRRVDLGALTAVLGSYGGHLRHGGAWQAWTELWHEHPWVGARFACERWRPRPRWMRWHARAGEGFRDAYRRLLRAAPPEGLIFLRVGRYIEFYGPQRCRAERVLRLRAVALPRAGYAFTAGFPVRHTPRFLCRALAAVSGVVVIGGGTAKPRVALLMPVTLPA